MHFVTLSLALAATGIYALPQVSKPEALDTRQMAPNLNGLDEIEKTLSKATSKLEPVLGGISMSIAHIPNATT
jgi:hypothetical protein